MMQFSQLKFKSHKNCTIMGLVYFYKTICCMLGADVAMLLNLQLGRLLIAIVEQALSAMEG